MKVHQVYESDQSVFLIMEFIEGGDLWSQVKTSNQIPQEDIAKIIFTILKALNYLHSIGIMHRDLKPENILIKNPKELENISIVDFGLATFFEKTSEFFFKRCGTPGFVAPEILNFNENKKKLYNEKCDIFSAGIIFFILYKVLYYFYNLN